MKPNSTKLPHTTKWRNFYMPGTDDIFIDTVSFEFIVLYHSSIFLIGALVRYGNQVLEIPVPYTVIVFIVGMLLGCLPTDSITLDVPPDSLLLIFLPILIFEASFAIDTYIFNKIIVQVLVLAFPAMGLITVLLAGTAQFVFKYDSWNWNIALLFGAVLSATDPVAVVAIMKDLGAGKRLGLLIEGESMLNDGSAIVLFQVLMGLIEGKHPTLSQLLVQVLRVAGGGPVFGYLSAHCIIFLLQFTFNDSLTEIAFTIAPAYIVYWIAEHDLEVSTVLAVVVLGTTLSNNKTAISPEVEYCLHYFWETLAFLANTSIFAICGAEVVQKVLLRAERKDYIYVIFLYVATQVIRAFAILVFAPILKRLGYGLDWKDGLVCTWSGLRGAVGLALALMISKSDVPSLKPDSVGKKILFHVSAIVVLTLLINATTTARLLKFLGQTDITPARRTAMRKAIGILAESRRKTMNVWKTDRFLADVDWDMVLITSTIEDPFMSTETEHDQEVMDRTGGECPLCGTLVPYVLTASESRAMKAEATRKYLKLFKQNLWIQFEHGLLSGYSARKLNELADEAADEDLRMIHSEEMRGIGKIPKILSTVKTGILRHTVSFTYEETIAMVVNRTFCFNVFVHVNQTILLPLGIYGVDSFVLGTHYLLLSFEKDTVEAFSLTDDFMLVILWIFFFFRVSWFRSRYVYTVWFLVNFLNLVIGTVEIFFVNLHGREDIVEVLYWMRLLRGAQLVEVLVHIVLYLINKTIRRQLTMSCDMARGFVRATEMAIPFIEHISDDLETQTEIATRAKENKLDVLRELALLQGMHPDIALEVKTSQAIRSVLNVMREGVRVLMEEGGIDVSEGLLFLKVIESKMKWLKSAPPKLQIPSSRKILAAIPWIDKNQFVIDYIQNVGQRLTFQYNDTIVQYNDPPNGIHVIISGLVRVVTPASPNDPDTMQTLDYLSTGNVVGEISELTKRPRMATLICETTVKTLYMSTESIETMFLFFSSLEPPLKARLWQVCAMRVAANVLSKVSSYQGLPREMLLSRLERLVVRHVSAPRLEISRDMSDVVLITGEAEDCSTKEMFVAPCYVPPKVKCLAFARVGEAGSMNPTLSFTMVSETSARLNPASIIERSQGRKSDTFKSENLSIAAGTTLSRNM